MRRRVRRWAEHVLTGTITWSTWVGRCGGTAWTPYRCWAWTTWRRWCDERRCASRRAPTALSRASTRGPWSRCVHALCPFPCRAHYVEYLAGLARGLDPIPIMDVPELVAELRRRALPLPERGPWDTDPIYAGMCAEVSSDIQMWKNHLNLHLTYLSRNNEVLRKRSVIFEETPLNL